MVTLMVTLSVVSVYAEQPSIPTAWAAAGLPSRGTAIELLYPPGEHPLLSVLLDRHLPLSAQPTALGLDVSTKGLRLKRIPFGGISAGEPHHGRLYGGVQLPDNPELYLVRREDYAYGSSHAVFHLQLALAKFRQHSDYSGPLIVSDLSKPRGGRNPPHRSHQSGRDVDVWLPLRANERGVTIRGGSAESFEPADFKHFCSMRPGHIDWDASWQLVKALVRTGQVEGIFLSRPRQRFLRRAAMRDGLRGEALDAIIQYPHTNLDAVVRHSRGHHKHIHVRFRCADYEAYCR